MIKADNLKKYFVKRSLFGKAGEIAKAVDGVSFSVEKGKTFGIVGESGSGKTTIAKIMSGVLKPDSGSVAIDGDIDMVFQDPFNSLNPRMKLLDIVGECLLLRKVSVEETRKHVLETLELVRLPGEDTINKYPHQFSGGERQRIAIARAIIRRPAAIILDEPVSNLDVSIQAEILNLLKDIQDTMNVTYLFISHDMRVAEFMADTIAVMKEGKFVEVAPREEIYSSPKHEYTKQLLAAIPTL